MYKFFYITSILAVLLLNACSTSRFIEPLEEKQLAINASAGGPIIGFAGTVIPIPFSSVSLAYGLREKSTIYGSVHATSLLFRTVQVDMGIRQSLYRSENPIIPNISGAIAVNGMTNFRAGDVRIFPEFNISPYWKYGQWTSYANVQAWLDAYKFGNDQLQFDDLVVPAIAVGQIFTNKKQTWSVAVEYKRLAPTLNEDFTVVDYKTLSDRGANGIYLSFTKFLNYDPKD